MTTLQIMKNAKAATQSLMLCDETKKNEILEAMAQSLLAHKEDILNANLIDLEKAMVSDVMKDRAFVKGDGKPPDACCQRHAETPSRREQASLRR